MSHTSFLQLKRKARKRRNWDWDRRTNQPMEFPGYGFWGDGGGSVSMLEFDGDASVCVEEDKTISFWVRWEIMSHAGGSSNRSEETRWWAPQKIDKVEYWELETWFWVMNQRWVLSFGFLMSLSFEIWEMDLRYEFWVMFFEFWIRFSPNTLLVSWFKIIWKL